MLPLSVQIVFGCFH